MAKNTSLFKKEKKTTKKEEKVKPIIDKLFFFQAGFIQRVGKHIMHRAPFIAEILRKFQIAHFFGAAKQIPLAFGFFAGEHKFKQMRVKAVESFENQLVQNHKRRIAGHIDNAVQLADRLLVRAD